MKKKVGTPDSPQCNKTTQSIKGKRNHMIAAESLCEYVFLIFIFNSFKEISYIGIDGMMVAIYNNV